MIAYHITPKRMQLTDANKKTIEGFLSMLFNAVKCCFFLLTAIFASTLYTIVIKTSISKITDKNTSFNFIIEWLFQFKPLHVYNTHHLEQS